MRSQSRKINLFRMLTALLVAVATLLAGLVVLAAALMTVSPRNGATGVAGNAGASVTYDEDLDPASVGSSTFLVYSSQRGLLPGTYTASGPTASFDPAAHFLPGESLLAVATGGIQTSSGLNVPACTWQFMAASVPASGAFTVDRPITPGATTRSIALADVNGDGWLDGVVGNDLWPSPQNVVYLNNGAGQFSGGTKNVGSGFDSTRVIALADIDRNGAPDVVVGNGGEQSIVYLNDGSGNFTAGQRPFGQPADSVGDLAVADFNGDGWLDIVASLSGQQPHIYLSAFGFFDAAGTAIGEASWETVSVDAADFEGDGDLDLVLGNKSTSVRNVILRNDGAGTFTTWLNFGNIDDESRVARFLDANQDGEMDVALGNYASQNAVYLGNGAGGFDPSTAMPFGTGTDHTEDIVIGDFNGDSFPDIAVANRNQQNRVYFYDPLLQDYGTDSNFGPANDISLSLAPGDIDGDGDLDLVVGNYGQQSVAYLNGSDVDAYAPSVTKSGVTVSPYTTGSVVTWTISARHNGPAADLYVTDMLGPDFTYLSHTAEPALTVSSTGPTFSGSWPNIALGQSVTLTLMTRLAGTIATTPTNTATFTTTSYLTPTETAPVVPYCVGQPCQYYPPGQAPAVGKRGVSEAPYTAGSIVTWTITTTNQGAVDDFYLTDRLGPDFSYVSHSASPALAGTYSTDPNFQAKWEAVEAGETITLTLVTQLSGSATGLPPANKASFTTTTYLTPTETAPAEPYCGVMPCPFLPPDVALTPASQSQTILPGRVVDYNFTLSNLGTLPDTFGLAISSPWSANLAPVSPVSVSGYGSLPLTLRITIPSGTISGSIVSSLVTATSQANPGTIDTAVATTMVGFDPGQGIEIEPVTIIVPPLNGTADTPIIVTHLITNTANSPDVVSVLASSPIHWPASAVVSPALPIILGPGMTARVTVTLAAPISATLRPMHTAIVTATSDLTTTAAVAQDTIIVTPAPDGDADGDGILNRYEDRDGDGGYNDDDSDGDSIPDYLDPDDDGDGVWTIYEYPNPTDPLNTDGDALPDYLDPDDDNDSRPTQDEGADPNGNGNPADALDNDGDGIPNYLDGDDGFVSGSDADGDGIPDTTECPATPCPDSDGDGAPDYIDLDSDNDGVLDSYEYDNPVGNNNAANDTDGDGTPDYRDADDDGDGRSTSDEQADPNGDGNPADAVDSDGDGIPDYLDTDDDGRAGGGDSDQDGIPDTAECPVLPCLDSDGDGTPNYQDTDSDNDGLHDRYEYDRNGDGTADDTDLDNSPDYRDPDDDGDGRPTTGEQADPNGDGNPADAVDNDGDGIPDYLDADDSGDILSDADGDGISNTTECPALPCLDSDGDGTPDYRDTDSDGDGVLDRFECPYQSCQDTDGDGAPDYRDFDDDEDGALTVLEQADPNADGNPVDAIDNDGDGIPDYLDADDYGGANGGDSDHDGIPDEAECAEGVPCEDSDGDTIPDYMDPIDNPASGLYLRIRENETIVWQGVVSGTVSAINLPPAQVEPEQVLSYTVTISNLGGLATSYQLTSTFSAGLDSPGQETVQEALAPAAVNTVIYIRQVAAIETATITIRFELNSPYGVRRIALNRTVRAVGRPSNLYLPIISKDD